MHLCILLTIKNELANRGHMNQRLFTLLLYMRRQVFVSIVLIVLLHIPAQAQDVWSLQRCVQYAIDHNISIQQDVLNKRLAHFTVLQSQLAQLPNR